MFRIGQKVDQSKFLEMSIPAFPGGLLVTSLTTSLQVPYQAPSREVIQVSEGLTGMPCFEVVAPPAAVFVVSMAV